MLAIYCIVIILILSIGKVPNCQRRCLKHSININVYAFSFILESRNSTIYIFHSSNLSLQIDFWVAPSTEIRQGEIDLVIRSPEFSFFDTLYFSHNPINDPFFSQEYDVAIPHVRFYRALNAYSIKVAYYILSFRKK